MIVASLPILRTALCLPKRQGRKSAATFKSSVRTCPQAYTRSNRAPLAQGLANKSASETNQAARSTSQAPYLIKEEPFGASSPLRAIVIGSGVSGIDMLRTLKRQSTNTSYIIYEKNPQIGGTWYENRYPGCASDDPSHVYQYPHSPNPNWSSIFAPKEEIENYLNEIVDKNGLRSSISCGHAVEKATWDESSGEWVVSVTETATGKTVVDRGHVLIDATGMFNDWKWPDIEGLQTFEGDLIHTANWPEGFKYEGKTLAVIGNGATGVQIMPVLQPKVKELFHFIRTKTWIPPPGAAVQLCQQYTEEKSGKFFSACITEFKANPAAYFEFLRELQWLSAKDRFPTICNAAEADKARKIITAYMTSALQSSPDLIAKLIPSFPVGCRRITASPSYLTCLTAPNVSLMTSPIRRITSSGLELKSGETVQVDAIICATGFNTSFIPRFPILGDGGKNLQDVWRGENGGPKAYMSVMVEGMPNYFRFLGPNGPLAHGAIPELTPHLCAYILSHIQKLQIENLSSVRPLPDAVRDFNEHVQAFMPRTAWAGTGCGGWYKGKGEGGKEGFGEVERGDGDKVGEGKEGRVTALHPGSQRHWAEMLRGVRWEDFEFRRRSGNGEENRFAYLGNGYTVEEVRDGRERERCC